ncbi:Hypothetical predicted protein, partial [Pelobates cultripes]
MTDLLDCHRQIAITTKQNKLRPSLDLAEQLNTLYTTEYAQCRENQEHAPQTNVYHTSGKATKYLASRLHNKYSSSKIAHEIGNDGLKKVTPKDISHEFASFYSKLYNLKEMGSTHNAITEELTSLQTPNFPSHPHVLHSHLLCQAMAREILTHLTHFYSNTRLQDFRTLQSRNSPTVQQFSYRQLHSFLHKYDTQVSPSLLANEKPT